jgi:uncharacterized protein YggE
LKGNRRQLGKEAAVFNKDCEIEGITISDIAQASVQPDTCILSIGIYESDKDPSKCLEMGAKRLQRIRHVLSKAEIELDALKTDSFDLSRNVDTWHEPKTGRPHYEFKAYRYSNDLELTLPNDSEVVSNAMTTLMRLDQTPSLSARYEASNLLEIEHAIVGRTMASAREKAEAIADASGVGLGALVSAQHEIDDRYISRERSYTATALKARDTSSDETSVPEFNAKAILVEAQVTGRWAIVTS